MPGNIRYNQDCSSCFSPLTPLSSVYPPLPLPPHTSTKLVIRASCCKQTGHSLTPKNDHPRYQNMRDLYQGVLSHRTADGVGSMGAQGGLYEGMSMSLITFFVISVLAKGSARQVEVDDGPGRQEIDTDTVVLSMQRYAIAQFGIRSSLPS